MPNPSLADTEDARDSAPLISAGLAYAAMLPLLAGAAAAWLLPAPSDALALRATLTWAGALLCFFSGVRRGLSFRQPGGATVVQLVATLLFFSLGILSLLSPWPLAAALLALAGYGIMLVMDPIAARRGEAPRYFARLRPVQLLLALAGVAALLPKLLG
ncbi:DUF3429 domain-containing protein [Pararoseomonas indoligenes]|uniref:DUF3429 domain-containing protein n=1 Tax=Roseomonas indoligenes TaxID=2820811 RepID=A0A940MWE4_9PROT|nr:DUF3429 domain-containing protein [Pararoseomonas indoligenes]